MYKKSSTAAIGLSFAALAVGLFVSSIANREVAAANQQDQQQTTNSQNHDEHFVGTIVSLNGARYILRDDVNDTWYHLDDQQSAGKFSGKKVDVQGTLDGRSDMIHVRSIHEESKG